MTDVQKTTVLTLRAASPGSEYSEQFLQGMLNRMAVSFFKYGAVADAYPSRVNAMASLDQRLDQYHATGNTEYLIDAANFAMIEFMHPADPDAFFHATDSDGSPGRTTTTGEVTAARNDALNGQDQTGAEDDG